jgi:hypothetical protein
VGDRAALRTARPGSEPQRRNRDDNVASQRNGVDIEVVREEETSRRAAGGEPNLVTRLPSKPQPSDRPAFRPTDSVFMTVSLPKFPRLVRLPRREDITPDASNETRSDRLFISRFSQSDEVRSATPR